MRIAITNDLYDISARLKEMDNEYEVWFDTVRQKFVLTKNKHTMLVFPYDVLDTRALDYAYFTRWENADSVASFVDRENQKLESKQVTAAQDRVENEFTRATRLAGV